MSGLRPDLPLEEVFEGAGTAIARAADEVPEAGPGERFVYSDINFFVLGEIVRRVTGQTLDRFARDRIFRPLLPDAAKAALSSARRGSLTGDRNMDRYVSVKADNARRFALDTLALAPRFGSHPDVGTAIYTANMTLASLAVLDGDIDTATEYLGRASMAPPAEELAYGRRVAAWVVVRQLVSAGERTAVAEFLDEMAAKSIVERDLILAAANDVRDGGTPARLFRTPDAYP